MERFFSLSHLTAEQLRSLYLDAVRVGRQVVEYDKPREEGYYELPLPEEMILENIAAAGGNYIVFHEDFEDFPDATSVVFPLANHPYTTVYVDFDNTLLDRFAEKYGLAQWRQREGDKDMYYPFSRFYTLEPMKCDKAD
jgi:hypothetical protein